MAAKGYRCYGNGHHDNRPPQAMARQKNNACTYDALTRKRLLNGPPERLTRKTLSEAKNLSTVWDKPPLASPILGESKSFQLFFLF